MLIMGFYFAPERAQGDIAFTPSMVFDAKEAVPRFAAGWTKLWA